MSYTNFFVAVLFHVFYTFKAILLILNFKWYVLVFFFFVFYVTKKINTQTKLKYLSILLKNFDFKLVRLWAFVRDGLVFGWYRRSYRAIPFVSYNLVVFIIVQSRIVLQYCRIIR